MAGKAMMVVCDCGAIWPWDRFKQDELKDCPHCKPDDWNLALNLGEGVVPIGFVREHNAYPIQPFDIRTDRHFWSAFGNAETEDSAACLVRMAQRNGSWRDFTKQEIDEFIGQPFHFNRLVSDQISDPPIKKNEDSTFSFTHQFVSTCFQSSPMNKSVKNKD